MAGLAMPGRWPLVYFGKLPCRGDFLRSPQGQALIQRLDPWFAQSLTRLSSDVRWKLVWDECPPLSFALLGSHSHVGLVGQLRASHDSSGRRFPFVLAAQFRSSDPLQWLAQGPLQLREAWAQLRQLDAGLAQQGDYDKVQQLLAADPGLRIEAPGAAQRAHWQAFMSEQSIGQLEDALTLPERPVDLRQCVLALGLLLQPLLREGPNSLAKGLRLPLPEGEWLRAEAAAFWTCLIASHLPGHATELVLCLPQQSPHWLQVSFNGATPRALCAALHPGMAEEDLISLSSPDWAEDCLDEHPGLPQFAAELGHGGLTLARLIKQFETVFANEGARA